MLTVLGALCGYRNAVIVPWFVSIVAWYCFSVSMHMGISPSKRRLFRGAVGRGTLGAM
ncbi:MAG: hypothetical protein R2716_10585 [Microthrixaceae bacterium]